jgi:hypothetical protein
MVKKLIGHLSSCRFALIVFQQSTQPLPIPYLSLFPTRRLIPQRKKKQVVFALVISFFMVMGFLMVQRPPQRTFPAQDQLRQAFLFDRP